MKDIEKELDKLVQEWASLQKSYVSLAMPCVGHHHHSRRIKLLRWDLKNIIPLTHYEHSLVHNGNLVIDIKDPLVKSYLDQMAVKNFKSYLLEQNITENEWLENKHKELKKILKINFSNVY